MSSRVACVDVPALPLQILARARRGPADAPLAVVAEDDPGALVEQVDRAAAKRRVRPGMRYAAALQLCPELRAAVVPAARRREVERELLELLWARSPRVEPDRERAGVFWVDPTGLGRLFGPLERWAEGVRGALAARGFEAGVVVGFARLPAWALARSRGGVLVTQSPAEEARLAGRAPLSRLDLPPALRDALAALGVGDLDGFLALPRGEISVRFGPKARALHARFADALREPMQPAPFEAPVRVEAELDPPDDDRGRLLFCVKGALHALMAELASRAFALGALRLRLELERAPPHGERVEPARPTRDALSLLELVRLRLAALALPAPVERLVLEAEPARLDGTQLSLFGGRRRDPDAARRGIARLRAAFGDEAVTRARLGDAWLPEHRAAWEPTDTVAAPGPVPPPDVGRLVRRVRAVPEPLAASPDGRPRLDPPLVALTGPYRLQGGWWERESVRDYFFAERADGALLWLFRDRRARRWFLHGRVD